MLFSAIGHQLSIFAKPEKFAKDQKLYSIFWLGTAERRKHRGERGSAPLGRESCDAAVSIRPADSPVRRREKTDGKPVPQLFRSVCLNPSAAKER